MRHQINPPRLIWGLLDVPHGAGHFSFQASSPSGKQMPPRALPHAWSFQSQPMWIPHILQSLLAANRGVELIPGNLSHRQHSRWQVQHCRPVIKEHPVGLHVQYLKSPGISPNNIHWMFQLPVQGINHFPVGYHFLSCVSCAFLIG